VAGLTKKGGVLNKKMGGFMGNGMLAFARKWGCFFFGMVHAWGAGAMDFSGGDSTSTDPDYVVELHCGAVIEDIFNIDYKSSTVELVFWLWTRSHEGPYPLVDFVDIKGATDIKVGELFIDTLYVGDSIYYLTQAQFHVKMLADLDDSRYPLDDQQISLVVEFIQEFADNMELTTTPQDLLIEPEFVQSWRIQDERAEVVETHIESTFGFFSKKAHAYKALQIEYTLTRKKLPLYMKAFFVVFVSFFLAAISFFLPNSKSEEKISLIIGALFTAIGNMYIVVSQTGGKPELGLVDQVHMLTFAFLLFFAVMAIIEQRGNWKNNLRFDFAIFLLSTAVYAASVAAICFL
jgi:hypothetical protein